MNASEIRQKFLEFQICLGYCFKEYFEDFKIPIEEKYLALYANVLNEYNEKLIPFYNKRKIKFNQFLFTIKFCLNKCGYTGNKSNRNKNNRT